jgi:hypothetical protein
MNHENMQNADFQKLKEISWRRPLSHPEIDQLRRCLESHPEWRRQWDEEAALDRLLRRLPAAQVSSNFTARVVRAAQSAPAPSGWRTWAFPPRVQWWPRYALGVAMFCVGFLSFHGYQRARGVQAGRDLANVSRLAASAPIGWFKDFDTIARLNKVQVADDDLLAALQ